jgi:hypothetical protein
VSKYITATFIGGVLAAAILAALAYILWPPGTLVGTLLIALFVLLVIAVAQHVQHRRRHRPAWGFPDGQARGLSESERLEIRLQALIDQERRLEIRELQLARQMRTQLATGETIDVVQTDLADQKLAEFVESDRKLVALIEAESQRAFYRVLNNRYAAAEGVNSALIVADLRAFVEEVARLYRPDSKDPLLETDIELVAKSLSSMALHLLVVIDGLPINLKSYSTARMYRLIRRGASYYGTYKAVRPYLEQGLNALQVARLALGMNPVAVSLAWAAGKLTTHGARTVGEHLLQRRALQLLNDFIRVIGFEAAMVYGGDFRHRDANWVLGAALVNLEISRGRDLAGRDAALKRLCNLALRHEFDRIRLVSQLGKHASVDIARVKPRVVMTSEERERVADELARHCEETDVDGDSETVRLWRESVETMLGIPVARKSRPLETRAKGLRERFARFRRRRLDRGTSGERDPE